MHSKGPAVAAGLLAVLGMATAAAAQEHDHGAGAGIAIVPDVAPFDAPAPDWVLAAMGHPAGFNIVAWGTDLQPDFHQDIAYQVVALDPLQPEAPASILFATDAVSGHDYDGVQAFQFAFPMTFIGEGPAGPYQVRAIDGNGTIVAHVNVTTVPSGGGEAGFSVPSDPIEGEGYAIRCGDGRALCDVLALRSRTTLGVTTRTGWFQLHGDGFPAFRAAPLSVGASATGFGFNARPTGPSVEVGLMGAGLPLSPALGGVPDEGSLGEGAPAAPNLVVTAETSDGGRLVGTYDPWTTVGTGTIQNLAILALDASGAPIAEAPFSARLLDPLGRTVWGSDDLWAPGGILHFAHRAEMAGVHVFEATAQLPGGATTLRMPYAVVDGGEAVAGVAQVTLDFDEGIKAREAAAFTLTLKQADGTPLDHSDALVVVGSGDNLLPLLLRAKLHTHDDGVMPFQLAFPSAGTYTIEVTPSPLEPRPVGIATAVFTVEVGDAEPATPTPSPDGDGQSVVALGPAVLVAAVAAAALLARRR